MVLVIFAVTIAVMFGFAVWSFSGLRYLGGNDIVELSDTEKSLIEKSKTLNGVQAFLSKYPDAEFLVDTSGTTAIDYRKGLISNRADLEIDPYIRLRVLLTPDSWLEDMFVECWDGSQNHISNGEDNVVAYLEKGTCLDDIQTPYEVWTTQGIIIVDIDKTTNTVLSVRVSDPINTNDALLIEENQKKIIQTVLSNIQVEKLIEGKDYLIQQVRHSGVGCTICTCPEEGCTLVAFSTVEAQDQGADMTVILNPVTGEIFDINTGQGWNKNLDRKSTRLNSSHIQKSRMPSSA